MVNLPRRSNAELGIIMRKLKQRIHLYQLPLVIGVQNAFSQQKDETLSDGKSQAHLQAHHWTRQTTGSILHMKQAKTTQSNASAW